MPSFLRTLSVDLPAATASGFPESVPAWYIGPSGETSCISSFEPP